jgi:hypothetical protein
MSTAKKRSASETGLRTRAARIVEKANLDQSTSHAAQFEVQVFARAPETFGAVILREGGNTLLIRRKKGYGSSKQTPELQTALNGKWTGRGWLSQRYEQHGYAGQFQKRNAF